MYSPEPLGLSAWLFEKEQGANPMIDIPSSGPAGEMPFTDIFDMDAQPDVTRFSLKRHFPTFKQVFLRWLADAYGDGRWILAPDVDTRCPDRAGDLTRHLVSFGRILRENNALAGLRQSEIHEKVQAYFKAQLDQCLSWLDRRGLLKIALAGAREEILDHESFFEFETDFPKWLPVTRFKRVLDVSEEQWGASEPQRSPLNYARATGTC